MTVSRYTLTVNRKYNCVGERETFNISYITFGKSAEFAQNKNIGARTDEYSNAIVHAFQGFRAPFSGKIVHIFPEQSAAFN